jgi:hypothetical protein
MNEPTLPEGTPRQLLVRNTPWWGFLVTTVALMLLAAGATAYMVNIGTGNGGKSGIPLSIGTASPTPLSDNGPVVLPGLVGGPPRPVARTVSAPQVPDVAPAPAKPPTPVPAVPRVPVPTVPPTPELPLPPVVGPGAPVPLVLPTAPPSSPDGLVPFLLDTVDGVLELVLP